MVELCPGTETRAGIAFESVVNSWYNINTIRDSPMGDYRKRTDRQIITVLFLYAKTAT